MSPAPEKIEKVPKYSSLIKILGSEDQSNKKEIARGRILGRHQRSARLKKKKRLVREKTGRGFTPDSARKDESSKGRL